MTPTQAAARKAHEIVQRGNAKRDPAVRSVLDRFPGAEIVDVRLDERCHEPAQDTDPRIRSRPPNGVPASMIVGPSGK